MPDDGWVRIYHPDQYPEPPDPDEPEDASKFSTVTKESFDVVWTKRGWLDLDEARMSADPEDIPEKAADRIAWIDEDPTLSAVRARTVLEDEEARDAPRVSVVEHAENVLENTTSAEDETTPDNENSEE